MPHVSKPSRLTELALKLTPPDKRSEMRAALNAGEVSPAPKYPGGPTDPDNPFGADDSDATAQFILKANEHRLRGCPPVTPTNAAAKFIVDTVAKLRARI